MSKKIHVKRTKQGSISKYYFDYKGFRTIIKEYANIEPKLYQGRVFSSRFKPFDTRKYDNLEKLVRDMIEIIDDSFQ